jgi:hypothetical protein
VKARPRTLALPRYYTLKDVSAWDLGKDGRRDLANRPRRAGDLIAGLNARGYWPTPLTTVSNPYIGDGPVQPTPGEFQSTNVGDIYDTSPYQTDYPVEGVSTSAYVRNMGELIEALGT